MRKAIVIDNLIDTKTIHRFDGFPFLVLTNHKFSDVSTDARFMSFFKTKTTEVVDPSQFLENKNTTIKIDDAINYLYHRGFDEIVILTDFKISISKMLEAIITIKKFPSLRIVFESVDESLQYFEEGTYVLNKEHSTMFSLYPWGEEAIINLDYTLEKITKYKLSTPLENIRFFQRIVLLNVEKGAVVLIRKSGDENEN